MTTSSTASSRAGPVAALAPEAEEALAPVRRWLLDAARRDGEAELAAARARAGQRLAEAREEAARLVDAARAEGEALGAETAAREVARGRREARSAVLRAQAELHAMLRDRARASVADLAAGPDGAALRASLEARARAVLGPAATIRPAPDGGVLAEDGPRRVDLSARALADAALDRLGPEVTRLWTPEPA